MENLQVVVEEWMQYACIKATERRRIALDISSALAPQSRLEFDAICRLSL